MRKLYFYIGLCCCICLLPNLVIGQVKPNTQTQPGSTTQTLNPIPLAYATGTPVNVIRTWNAEKPFSTDTLISNASRTVQEVQQATLYVDGLGRPMQTVAKKITPNGYDLVSPQVYDQFDREVFKYLPYVDSSSDGNFKNDPFHKQSNFEKAFYNPTNDANGEKFFYNKTDFDASPLNRPVKTYPAGNSWAGKGVGTSLQYLVNDYLDSVCIWNINFSTGAVPVFAGYYATGLLQKHIIVDERGNSAIEYKDKDGHTILKKAQVSGTVYSGHTGWLCTYYIYDERNNLRFVIQPLGVTALKTASWVFDNTTWSASTIAKELCFSYEYDGRGRKTIKRIPGAGEVWTVYDTRDRPVMIQDANLRTQNNWLYTVYDSLNRPVKTGIWTNSGNRTYHQGLANNGGNYPNPSSNWTILSQTYYDDYSWVSGTGSGISSSAYTGYNSNTNYFYTASDASYPYARALTATNLTRGVITGTKVNVINTGTYLYSVSWYDDRMRIIQTQSTNYTGDVDTTVMQYSFSGQVLSTLVCHGKGGINPQAYKVLTAPAYDAAGRVQFINRTTGNSQTVKVADNIYNELGQLKVKSIGRQRVSLTDSTYTSAPVETLKYDYNIRGWLRGINMNYADSLNGETNWFGMELNYDFGFSSSQLNGNIAGIKWRNGGDGQRRAYGFSYDAVNRLTKADFTQNSGGSAWDISGGIDFSVHSIKYDANGNLTQMYQMGIQLNSIIEVDSLTYGYVTNSNRLNYVTDKQNDVTSHLGDFTEITNNTSQDYWYDGNGNLTQDSNKSIHNIHYNFLNLPDSITVNGKGTIKYVYTATGAKLQKITVDNISGTAAITKTDYAGLFVYQNDTLQYVAQPEGRVRPKTPGQSSMMYYDYFVTDHLGNTRVVLTDEKQQDVYPAATLEKNTNGFATEQNFYTINTADTIGVKSIASWGNTTGRPTYDNNGNPPYNNNPYLTTTDSSKVVYRLNGNTGDKTGLGITLKVMTGDAVDIYAKSFWHSTGTNPNNTNYISSAITNFLASFAGTPAITGSGKGATATTLNTSVTTTPLTNWLHDSVPNPTLISVPRAYINWILFDEQFKVIGSGSGFDGVSTSSDAIKSHHQTVTINTSGYLYIYCSNESNIDVFFDNLQAIHTRGPLLETNNYYPFGLIQSGISSQAAGKAENLFRFNKGSELQHKEFSDGKGLEWYATQLRTLDPQVGRWWQVDPKPNMAESPYASMGNNPILNNDPLGDTIFIDNNGVSLLYANGAVMNANGTAYTGKIRGFLKQTMDALSKINSVTEGSQVLSTLQSSANNFTIKDASGNPHKDINGNGSTEFVPDDHDKEFGVAYTEVGSNKASLGGTGGILYFDPSGSTGEVTVQGGGVDINPTTNLAHEMFHGYEANIGMANNDDALGTGLSRMEYRASYFENTIRAGLHSSLRTEYHFRNSVGGQGTAQLLDSKGAPIAVSPTTLPCQIAEEYTKYQMIQ